MNGLLKYFTQEELEEEKRNWFEQKYGENIKRLRKVREEYDRH